MTSKTPSGAHTAAARTEDIINRWARLGAGFDGPASQDPIDIEELIVETPFAARLNERVFEMSASWISQYSALIYDDKLVGLLKVASNETQAVVGAILEFALMGGMPDEQRARIAALQNDLSPLPTQEHLHPAILEWPGSARRIEKETLPGYAKWGFWYNNKKLKRNALLSRRWMLKALPEIRIRSLLGPGDEAEVLFLLLAKTRATTAQLRRVIAQSTQKRPGNPDLVINALAERGLIVKVSPSAWTLSPFMASMLKAPQEDERPGSEIVSL